MQLVFSQACLLTLFVPSCSFRSALRTCPHLFFNGRLQQAWRNPSVRRCRACVTRQCSGILLNIFQIVIVIEINRFGPPEETYYMEVFADPQDENVVYVLNAPVMKSIDGGKTFKKLETPHGDNHQFMD